MFDITSLGELLIDFTPHGVSLTGNAIFERNPGGAPANLAAAAARLGARTSFIGKVGNDQFGKFLNTTLENNQVDTNGLILSDRYSTTLAFVHLDLAGDRSFSFYRNPGADMMLEVKDIDFNTIKQSKIFHAGSVSLTSEPSRTATLEAFKFAKDNDIIVSYDPNLRPPLWKSLDEARIEINRGLQYADIIKISDEELEFITGEKDLNKGTEILSNMGIKLILVTLGPNGAFFRNGNNNGLLKGYKVDTIDTTGAGDAFLGAVLYKLKGVSKDDLASLPIKFIEEVVNFGNVVGALTTTRKGGISGIPSIEEINEFIESHKR